MKLSHCVSEYHLQNIGYFDKDIKIFDGFIIYTLCVSNLFTGRFYAGFRFRQQYITEKYITMTS